VSAQTTANKEWLTALIALTGDQRSIHERLVVRSSLASWLSLQPFSA